MSHLEINESTPIAKNISTTVQAHIISISFSKQMIRYHAGDQFYFRMSYF